MSQTCSPRSACWRPCPRRRWRRKAAAGRRARAAVACTGFSHPVRVGLCLQLFVLDRAPLGNFVPLAALHPVRPLLSPPPPPLSCNLHCPPAAALQAPAAPGRAQKTWSRGWCWRSPLTQGEHPAPLELCIGQGGQQAALGRHPMGGMRHHPWLLLIPAIPLPLPPPFCSRGATLRITLLAAGFIVGASTLPLLCGAAHVVWRAAEVEQRAPVGCASRPCCLAC